MSEKIRIDNIRGLYQRTLGGESAYFKVKISRWFFFFESYQLDPPYEKITLFPDATVKPSLVSTELGSMRLRLCSYQESRKNNWLDYDKPTSLKSVVLEELKQWCCTFRVDRDLQKSMDELNRRLQYVNALRLSALFPPSSFAKEKEDTLSRVFYELEQELTTAMSKLEREYQARQLHERVEGVNVTLATVLTKLVYFLAFIFRDTPAVPLHAGNIKSLQKADAAVDPILKPFHQTLTGEALGQLVKTPLLMRVMHPEGGESKGDIVNVDATLSEADNPYFHVKAGQYRLREERLSALNSTKVPIGIEPLLLKNHPHAIKSFLMLHGWLYELGLLQLLLKNVSTLLFQGGHLAVAELPQTVDVIWRSYQEIQRGIVAHVNTLKTVTAEVADGHMVHHRHRVSSHWMASQQKAKEDIAPLFEQLKKVSQHINQVTILLDHAHQSAVTHQIAALVTLCATQTQRLKARHGIVLAGEKDTQAFDQKKSPEEKHINDFVQSIYEQLLIERVSLGGKKLDRGVFKDMALMEGLYQKLSPCSKESGWRMGLLRLYLAKCLDKDYRQGLKELAALAQGNTESRAVLLFLEAYTRHSLGEKTHFLEPYQQALAHPDQKPLGSFLSGLLSAVIMPKEINRLTASGFHDPRKEANHRQHLNVLLGQSAGAFSENLKPFCEAVARRLNAAPILLLPLHTRATLFNPVSLQEKANVNKEEKSPVAVKRDG